MKIWLRAITVPTLLCVAGVCYLFVQLPSAAEYLCEERDKDDPLNLLECDTSQVCFLKGRIVETNEWYTSYRTSDVRECIDKDKLVFEHIADDPDADFSKSIIKDRETGVVYWTMGG